MDTKRGIAGLDEVKRNLQHYVVHDLFTEETEPDRNNLSFWPSSKAVVMNAISQASAPRFVNDIIRF